MRRDHARQGLLFLAVVLCLQGCATAGDGPKPAADPAPAGQSSHDPLEPMNRTFFDFNMGLYDYFLHPVAKGYEAITPSILRKGISNVFLNSTYPYIFLNDFLQGRGQQGFSDLSRFLVNSIFGLGGLFDVASHLDLPPHENSFGVTLGVWGVPQGPYLVLPFYGPSSVRSLPGLAMGIFASPFYYVTSNPAQWSLTGVGVVDKGYTSRTEVQLVKEAVNPYVFARDGWEQHEQYLISGGKVSTTQLLEGLGPLPEMPTVPAESSPAAPTESSPAAPAASTQSTQ